MRDDANNGATVDEIVALRIDTTTLWLCTHGGPGIRAGVSTLLSKLGWQIHDRQQPSDDITRMRIADALGAASSPAATDWLLRQLADDPDALVPQPPFPQEFLCRRPRLLLTGPANAGKSALLNAWCGYGRAVVSAIPGTTRDLVAALVDCHGWTCEVLIPAGLRDTDDELEAAGQDLAQQARQWVDAVLYVQPVDQKDAALARQAPTATTF